MHKSLKERVLESTDIVDVIGERIALKKKGREFVGLCPFHPDHRPSLSVNPEKRIFMCWACRTGGDVISFVQKRDGLDFVAALRLLAERAGIEVEDKPDAGGPRIPKAALYKALDWARQLFHRALVESDAGKAAREYALSRGLTRETIDALHVGFTGSEWEGLYRAARRAGLSDEILVEAGLVIRRDSGQGCFDRFRDRLMFPIRDPQGRTIGFGGRTLVGDDAKYLNSPEGVLFDKSRILYGFDRARGAIEQSKRAIVVEGYMDAILLQQHGFSNVVATMGTALTEAHAKLLRSCAEELVFCFDGDDAGYRAADRAVPLALAGQFDVRVVIMPSGIDPADCVKQQGPAAFEALLLSAVDALQFKWNRTFTSYGERGSRGRRQAVEEFLRFVAGASSAGGISALDQAMLVARLSDMLGVPTGVVHDLLSRFLTKPRSEARSVTPDIVDSSAYDASIQGLPAALVASVEELFGLVLLRPDCFGATDEILAAAASYCPAWQQFHKLCVEIVETEGGLSSESLLARCDDALLCELLSRASARVSPADAAPAVYAAAHDRLSAELDLLQLGELRGQLKGRGADDATANAVFRTMLGLASRQSGPLPGDVRLGTTVRRPA